MKTIIVATDLSEDANNALEYGAALARGINATLVIYNSFVFPQHAHNSLMLASGIDELIASNEASLRYSALRIKHTYHIETHWESTLNNIEDELDKQVEKHDASLVIMGMRGDSIDQKMFGNTTTTIIKKATYPILAVPRNAKFHGISKILFACDYNCNFSDNAMLILRYLALALKAEIQILNVQKVKKMTPELMESSGKREAISPHFDGLKYYYNDLDDCGVIEGISHEIVKYDADILVMVPKKYGFWDSMVHRSKTCSMAAKSSIPLLSLPQQL